MKRSFAVVSVCLTAGVYALPASAVTVGGLAVDAPASTDDSISVVTSMGIEYYIPLTSNHSGTYGVGTRTLWHHRPVQRFGRWLPVY